MNKEKIYDAGINIFEAVLTIMVLLANLFSMFMGGALAFDAMNLQIYTHVFLGIFFVVGGFIIFTLTVAGVVFKFKKNEKGKQLMERWAMTFVINGVTIMMVDLMWHLCITGQLDHSLPKFLQIIICIIMTGLYLKETHRQFKVEVEHVRRINQIQN